MNCNSCNIEMDFHHPLEGSFFLCPQCNKVDYPLFPLFSKAGKDKDSAPRISKEKLSHTHTPQPANIANTSLIDKEIEEELDRVVERGRD